MKKKSKRSKRSKSRVYSKKSAKRTYNKAMKRRHRRGNPPSLDNLKSLVPSNPNQILKADTWMDVGKTAGVAGLGYAAPGILEVMSNQWLSKKFIEKGWFKERAPQKAAALIDLGVLGASMYAAASMSSSPMVKQHALPFMVGLGVRTVKDMLDAFLGTTPDSFSMNVRSVFGLTANAAVTSASVKIGVVPGDKGKFIDSAGVSFEATERDGKFYDKASPSVLVVKSDGTAWTSADPTLKEMWGLAGYYYDSPAMGAYYYDSPRGLPAGDVGSYGRSFGDMGAHNSRSFGDMGSWSETAVVAKNPFDDPMGDAGF